MTDLNVKTISRSHPTEIELADFLAGGLAKDARERIEKHLGSCNKCLSGVVAAHEAVSAFNKSNPRKKARSPAGKAAGS